MPAPVSFAETALRHTWHTRGLDESDITSYINSHAAIKRRRGSCWLRGGAVRTGAVLTLGACGERNGRPLFNNLKHGNADPAP